MHTPLKAPAIITKPCRYGTMVFPRGDSFVGRSLDLYGEYSEDEVVLFRKLIGEGDTVVEAGANIGALTLPLAHLVGATGRVIAAEPQRLIFQVLCANLALNEIENVEALPFGFSDAAGKSRIAVTSYSSNANFGGAEMGGQGEEIDLRSIDSLALDKLAFLKIDVEGHEIATLRGAAESLARCKPRLYVENDRKQNSAELISLMRDQGYRLWWHIAPLFSPQNFYGFGGNLFGNTVSLNLLCLHKEDAISDAEVAGWGLQLRPVAGADDWFDRW